MQVIMHVFRPIRQIFPLANRSTDWQSGRSFGIHVNLLANGKIWCMGQPTGKVVNRCTKFTMLFPSTKLLVSLPANRSIYNQNPEHLRQHTTPPFSFAKTNFIQSSLTSRENFCFGFHLNELQPLRSRQR